MKRKLFLVISFLILSIFLTGCSGSGIVTPVTSEVGGDFYICENLVRGMYTALSNRNFTQALSYCKSGGLTFKYVNGLWNFAQEHPTFYVTYQVYEVYNFSYSGGKLKLYYDYSWTTNTISYLYGRLMIFEKVNGVWKMS